MHSKLLPAYCISGRPLKEPDGVVIHYFSAKNVDPDNKFSMPHCRQLFKDLNLPRERRETYMYQKKWPDYRFYASAHIMIGRCGTVWQLVSPKLQAYHAGHSLMDRRTHCNQWTFGVELIGDEESGFSREQYHALAKLLIEWEDKYDIPRHHIAGHDKVRYDWIETQGLGCYPYKYDPSGSRDGSGENFDWMYLGKLMNDIKPNPAGVAGLAMLDHLDQVSGGGL